jgi:hypothetical protein
MEDFFHLPSSFAHTAVQPIDVRPQLFSST